MTAARTKTGTDFTVHHTTCRQPTAGLAWSGPCTCGHFRVRHAAAIHAAIPTDNGHCTGRNLAGRCLTSECGCTSFASLQSRKDTR